MTNYTERGFWLLLKNIPILGIGVIVFLAYLFFSGIALTHSSGKQMKQLYVAVSAILILIAVFAYKECFVKTPGTHIPSTSATPTPVPPTPVPTETPKNPEIENFFSQEEYKKKYKAISIYSNTSSDYWGLISGTANIAEKTEVVARIKLSNFTYSINEEMELEINTKQTKHDIYGASIPKGEQVWAYGPFEVPSNTISWENFLKDQESRVSRAVWAQQMNGALTRAYKLSNLEAGKKAKSYLLKSLVEENAFSNVKNITIDGVLFKKDGEILEVKQSELDDLFNFGIGPQIEPLREEEEVELYLKGEEPYGGKVRLFNDIIKYRKDNGLDPLTGF